MYEKRGIAAGAQQSANEQLPERDSRYMRYHQTAEYPCRETYIRNRCACQQGFNGICRQNAWTYGHQDNQNICTDSGQDRVRRNERNEEQICTPINLNKSDISMKCKNSEARGGINCCCKKQTGRIEPTFFPSSNITTVVSDNLY